VKTKEKPITGFKAFNSDMTCQGFQYEVGKTYKHDGPVELCRSGFHFCENPLDVLNYYDLTTSKFATVTARGLISRASDGDSKVCAAELSVDACLTLPEFVASSVQWMLDFCKSKKPASGHYSNLAASGYSSNLAASGYSSNLAASGDSSNLAASGGSSNLAASGHYSKLAASGGSSIAGGVAHGCRAMVGENGTIVLSRWVESEKRWRVSVGYTGENIKPNIWYKLDDEGNFVEVEG
jgi:hypothetical protein